MKGFTLLEVMIATAIASVLSVSLFVALRQTMGFQRATDTIVDAYGKAAIIQNQMERDFMGFFVPIQAYDLTSTATPAPGAPQKKKIEQIDRIFFAPPSKEQFQLLSFITTNAIQVYWGKTVGEPKPLVARVVYRLIEQKSANKDEEISYTLQRQESYHLDFVAFEGPLEKQKIRAYDIVSDIKEMKVAYIARVYKNEDKASTQPTPGKAGNVSSSGSSAASGEAQKSEARKGLEGQADKRNKLPTWTYKEFSEWDWSPKKAKPAKPGEKEKTTESSDQKKGEQVSRVPFYIKVNLLLWDPAHQRTTPFEFMFARKPFEAEELEKDELEQSKKAGPAQMPSLKPVFDFLKMPGVMPAPKAQAPQKSLTITSQRKPGLPGMNAMQPMNVSRNPILLNMKQEKRDS
jgi:prepilin-type N-terminal cleavage/methylation domain-containing protein